MKTRILLVWIWDSPTKDFPKSDARSGTCATCPSVQHNSLEFIPPLKELIHVTRNGFLGLENKQDIMIGTQHETMGKIDNLGIQIGNKIDHNRLEIKSEIHALRDDFKSHFEERLLKMEFELTEIKAKVARIKHSSHNSKTKISQAE